MKSSWIIHFSILVLSHVSIAQECHFPEELVKPCTCFYRFLRCSGSKITEQVITSVFQRLTERLPSHEHSIDSFELINSAVDTVAPRMFGKFQVRNYFRLRGNTIANFSIGDFGELFFLDVSSNKMREFDKDTFVGLNDLRILNVANVGFKRLKKEYFTHLRNLERLILSGNGIEHIDIDAFTSEYENNFALSRIDLSSNLLTRLPDNVFTVLRRPEVINLSNNKLIRLSEIFNFSPDMSQFEPVKIILSNNSLSSEHLDEKMFDKVVEKNNWIELDLSHNHIKRINSKVFQKLLNNSESSGQSTINLSNNPVECLSCSHRWLFDDGDSSAGKTLLRYRIILSSCSDTSKEFWRLSLSDFSKCNRRRRAQ